MGTVVANLGENVTKALGVFTDLPKVAAPFTVIVNRALVTDFGNDHLPKFGIERVVVQQAVEVQGEIGPSGEQVFKALNDVHDRFRAYGTITNEFSASGINIQPQFYEIVFYGTGLNLVIQTDSSARTIQVSVDGGALGSNVYPSGGSALLNGRNYASNQPLNIASGLALGTHTVRVFSGGTIRLYGFEVLNTASTLQLVPGSTYNGSRKSTKTALTTDSYNSNFESGTLGTKGGHVVVYAKADGSIGKAVQPTDTTALYLTAASHTNEEIIRAYSFREFGAGRTDDFSNTASASSLAFTLDDGTTTLVGSSVTIAPNNGLDAVTPSGVSSFLTLTFVGTGLDVLVTASSTSPDSHTVTIDGVSQGTITSLPSASGYSILKIASGLPYGTHTVKITRTVSAVAGIQFNRFTTYGPKKPTIPTSATELADYYLMANYVANTNAGNGTSDYIGVGTLRKPNGRELVYSGTGWSVAGVVFGSFPYQVESNASGDYVELTFFGTGFEVRFANSTVTDTSTLSVDGSSVLSGFTTSVYGSGVTFTSSTGVISQTVNTFQVAGVQVSGLTLGVHKVRLTHNSTTRLVLLGFDVITPVHSPKSNQPGDLQNTLTVGSQAIGDSRKFSTQSVKALANWSQAVGVSTSPSTTSTTAVPVPDMACVVKTTGNPIEIFYSIEFTNGNVGAATVFQIYVDGVPIGSLKAPSEYVANYNIDLSDSYIVPVAAGTHIVQLFWNVQVGTATALSTRRNLKAREI